MSNLNLEVIPNLINAIANKPIKEINFNELLECVYKAIRISENYLSNLKDIVNTIGTKTFGSESYQIFKSDDEIHKFLEHQTACVNSIKKLDDATLTKFINAIIANPKIFPELLHLFSFQTPILK